MSKSGSKSQRAITLRDLVSDTLIYGAAGVANRAIGFLLLPITTAILDPADYGVLGLFGATASILWLLVSLGVPSAFYRFYAESSQSKTRARLLGSSLALCVLQSAAAIGLVALVGKEISTWLFGIAAIWPAMLLAGNAVCSTLIAFGAGRLQADGLAVRYLIVNLASVLCSRGIGLTLLFLGYGPWGWIIGELIGLCLSLPLLIVMAWPKQRPVIRRATMRGVVWYGMLLTPAYVSQWLMLGCDKLIMKGTLLQPEQAIGFYSVGERISSIIMFSNVAFALAWRRFAFRNMALEEGRALLARGMKLYVLASGLMALALALLGDDLTHWMIRAEFAPGAVVIVPLTVAWWLAGLGDTANIGLHRVKRPALISVINISAAVMNVTLNFWAIPRYGILGAAYTTLVSQAARAAAIWLASQATFPVPFDYRGTGVALAIFGTVFAVAYAFGSIFVAELPRPWGWLAATVSESLAVLIAVGTLWYLPVLHREERDAVGRMVRTLTRRGNQPGPLDSS